MLSYQKDDILYNLKASSTLILYPAILILMALVVVLPLNEDGPKSWLIRILIYPVFLIPAAVLGMALFTAAIELSGLVLLGYALAAPCIFVYKKTAQSNHPIAKFLHYGAMFSLALVAACKGLIKVLDKIFRFFWSGDHGILNEAQMPDDLIADTVTEGLLFSPIRAIFSLIFSPVILTLFIGGAALSLASLPFVLIAAGFQGLSILITKPCHPSEAKRAERVEKGNTRQRIHQEVLYALETAISTLDPEVMPQITGYITQAMNKLLDCFNYLPRDTETALPAAVVTHFETFIAGSTGDTILADQKQLMRDLLSMPMLLDLAGINRKKLLKNRQKYGETPQASRATTPAFENTTTTQDAANGPPAYEDVVENPERYAQRRRNS